MHQPKTLSFITRAIGWVITLCFLLGCKTSRPDTQSNLIQSEGGARADGQPQYDKCVAISGNGVRIYGILYGLARHLELYGDIDATSGGSSAAVSQFFLEAMVSNPIFDTHAAGDRDRIKTEEQAKKLALMLKSLTGYIDEYGITGEGLGFELADFYALFRSPGAQSDQILKALNVVYSAIGMLFNADAASFMRENPTHVATFMQRGEADLPTQGLIFHRPPGIKYDSLAKLFNRGAYFYTGLHRASNRMFTDFLNLCWQDAVGKTWREIAYEDYDATARNIPTKKSVCGALFAQALDLYREDLYGGRDPLAAKLDNFEIDSPLRRMPGEFLPVLVGTGIIWGSETNTMMDNAIDHVLANGTPYSGWNPNFDDYRLGYFGANADLDRIRGSVETKTQSLLSRGFAADPITLRNQIESQNTTGDKLNFKTARFFPLYNGTESGQVYGSWLQALTTSPSEPGLGQAVKFRIRAPYSRETGSNALQENEMTELYSVGGWSDHRPVHVLKEMGCANVASLTQPLGKLPRDPIPKALGATAEQVGDYMARQEADSAAAKPRPSTYYTSLSDADAILCSFLNTYDVSIAHRYGFDAYRSTIFADPLSLYRSSITYDKFQSKTANPNVCITPPDQLARGEDDERNFAQRMTDNIQNSFESLNEKRKKTQKRILEWTDFFRPQPLETE